MVCAVRGWAAGIGFQLAAAADFTVAATDSRFWEPFMERGFTPDSGATWLLPRVVGPSGARDLLLLGRKLSGIEAPNGASCIGPSMPNESKMRHHSLPLNSPTGQRSRSA